MMHLSLVQFLSTEIISYSNNEMKIAFMLPSQGMYFTMGYSEQLGPQMTFLILYISKGSRQTAKT